MNIKMSSSFKRWTIASSALAILYFLFIASIPNLVPFTPHDDSLFQKLALRIANGQWLGEDYGSLTLAKGPFHSWQMAFAYRLGLSPGFWLHSLYFFSTWIFCTFAMPACRWWWRLIGLVAFNLDPWRFTSFGIRLLREQTYIPFLIIGISLLIYSIDKISDSVYFRKKANLIPDLKILIALLVSGFSLGLLLITREARLVVYATTILALLLITSRTIFLYPNKKFGILSALSIIIVYLLVLSAPLGLVAYQNYNKYGTTITNEFEEGNFKSFYQDLISVQLIGDKSKPWVPLTLKTIESLHSNAPNTQLSAVLSDLNPNWKKFACEQHKQACGEYGGGWLMWALRDSLFEQEEVMIPIDFQILTENLRHELSTICLSNKELYSCNKSAFGYLPYPSRWGHGKNLPLLAFQDFKNKIKGSLFPQLISYPPAVYDELGSQSKLAAKLRIRIAEKKDEQVKWTRYTSFLYDLGSLARVFMIIFAVFVGLTLRVGIKRYFSDPGMLIILFFFLIQLLILVLVELSSFHTGGYIIIASPLITALSCRSLAVGARRSITFTSLP
jgi:hypothetical protein